MEKILSASGQLFTDKDAAEIKASTLSHEIGVDYKVFEELGGYYISREQGFKSEVQNTEPVIEQKVIDNPNYESETSHIEVEQPIPVSQEQEEAQAEAAPAYGKYSKFNQDKIHIKPSMWGYLGMFLLSFVGLWVFFDPNSVSSLLLGGKVGRELEGSSLLAGKGLGLLIMLFSLGRIGIDWWANLYIIDLTTIESRHGILSKKKMRINIKDIRAIDMSQTILDRMCVVGTVSLATAGTSGDEVVMEKIAFPTEVQNLIQKRLDDSQN